MMKYTPLLVLAVFAAIVTGCNLNAPVETSPTLTPNIQTVGQVETPAMPSTPTPEPTPTVEPAVLLQIADRYLLNGYYENAVYTYQLLLQQDGAPQDARSSAAFGMGQAALREGLFEDAVSALTLFIDQYGSDSRIPQAHFLRGDAYLGSSRWAEAIEDFRTYLNLRSDLIDSYALERIGDAQLALGQVPAALESYQRASDTSRDLVPQLALRERVAQVYLNAGQPEEAIAQYDAILSVAQNAPYRAGIELLAANAALSAENLDDALIRMDRVYTNYPDRPEAYLAMQTLVENGRAVDNYKRGQVSFNYGDYQGAIEALNTHSMQNVGDIPAQLYLLLGQAYREIGNTPAALTAFQTIVDTYPTDPLFGDALLEQGRTRFVGGDVSGAIEHYMRIADTYDYLPEAPEALWRAGFLYSTNDQPTQARVVFERLAARYPDSNQARDGLFLAASDAYNAGDLTSAERYYAELAVKATGEDLASAYLWVGRLALQRDDTRTATQAFQQATQAAPDSYFSARADDLIDGREAFQQPAAYRFQFDDAAEIAQAESWLRETFDITQEGVLWQLSLELANDPRLVRGRELWTVAAYDEARAEFDGLLQANQTNALASYQLAIYFRGIGAYQESIVAASYVIRNANVGTLEAPPYIARMRYPTYYLDVVQDVTARRNVDPLLMYSLIRHESLFDTNATAAAGEKGLTQVVPPTGEYIASRLQWPDYQHADLFRPYAGIEFGAYYLSEQLQLFDGNTTAALSAYNAGPGRGASWLEMAGGDHDLFMTAITISSTRTYVQRIYSYYNIYRELYAAPA